MVVVANWKMHGDLAFLSRWAAAFLGDGGGRFAGLEVVVCPPFPYLAAARKVLPAAVFVGAQDVSGRAMAGAYSGEVSAAMVADVGGSYCLVGHSERRAAGDSDADCAAKLAAAFAGGLSPILCVGESFRQRAAGQTTAVIDGQLTAACGGLSEEKRAELTVAYEPLWAIGSGKTPSPEEIDEVHAAIRKKMIAKTAAFGGRMRVLYGGSVSRANASAILGAANVDGVLAGGASLEATVFADICRRAASFL